MGKLILPKQNAKEDVIKKVLKIYYEKNKEGAEEISNKELVEKEQKEGLTATDLAGLTKMPEMLRYFGLVTYNYKAKKSRITENGIRYYEAFIKKDISTQYEILAESIICDIFGIGADYAGGNTAIKSGYSKLEVPKLFVRSIMDYSGITGQEFSYLIWDIDNNNHTYEMSCTLLEKEQNKGIDLKKGANGFGKFDDPKVHAFLRMTGFCYIDEQKKYQLHSLVLKKYGDIFASLDIFNNRVKVEDEECIILLKDNEDVDCSEIYKNSLLETEGYNIKDKEIDKQNKRKPQIINSKKGRKYKVNVRLGKTAQRVANYKCELDASHITFNTKESTVSKEHAFMETHHLIPMKAQGDYPTINLDRIENLICLCPNCHSKIHYGMEKDKMNAILALYNKKFAELKKETGISLSEKELFVKYYLK